MRIERSNEQRLTIVAFPWLFGAICFPMSILFLYGLVGCVTRGGIISDNSLTNLVVFCGTFLAATIFTKRSVFDFDRVQRELHWHRLGFFGRTSGVLRFDQIKSVFLESFASRSAIFR